MIKGLTFSNAITISPEPGAIEPLGKHGLALGYAIVKTPSLDLKSIKDTHRELYRELGDRL